MKSPGAELEICTRTGVYSQISNLLSFRGDTECWSNYSAFRNTRSSWIPIHRINWFSQLLCACR